MKRVFKIIAAASSSSKTPCSMSAVRGISTALSKQSTAVTTNPGRCNSSTKATSSAIFVNSLAKTSFSSDANNKPSFTTLRTKTKTAAAMAASRVSSMFDSLRVNVQTSLNQQFTNSGEIINTATTAAAGNLAALKSGTAGALMLGFLFADLFDDR